MIKKFWPILGFIFILFIFFWQFFFKGLLPIASDTIVGLYHPYRDIYSKDYPNGIPFKNFLITDPVRQQYPWKKLSIDSIKKIELPLWNQYSFSGTPNLANFQSGVFYPLNIIFLLPYSFSWSLFIVLEPLLAGIFMYLFLKNLKLVNLASFFGGFVFAFSSFFVTWLEWGNILHTALWLPLILLSLDKLRKSRIWIFVLIFSLSSSFFAGHLQAFFYSFLVSLFYFLFRYFEKKELRFLFLFSVSSALSFLLILPQLLPTIKFIGLSARSSDLLIWQQEGWFIPWQHLLQILIPDFFGNPSTLNYWGVWNYGELSIYIGIVPLIFVLYSVLGRKEKEVIFFAIILVLAFVFSLPTFFAKIPYQLDIPFLSTSQPTRLIYLIDFSLAVLAGFGLNKFIKSNSYKNILVSLLVLGGFFALIIFLLLLNTFSLNTSNLEVAKRNFVFPFAIFIVTSTLLLLKIRTNKNLPYLLLSGLVIITIFDLFRFSWKFNTFSKQEYLFPKTQTTSYLEKNIGNFRIATTDPRIYPPNFSIIDEISSVEGYDPLFLKSYAEFISAINRNKPNINPPFGFNRIVRIENLNPRFLNLLGVKYILSFSDLTSLGYERVFQEGQTKIFENKNVIPKVFIAKKILSAKDKQQVINMMFENSFEPRTEVVVQDLTNLEIKGKGEVQVKSYNSNKVEVSIQTSSEEFMVLTDIFYPTWKAKLQNGKELKIYQSDYLFRGVVVPPGKNVITFYNALL